jgi:hypothetical protein
VGTFREIGQVLQLKQDVLAGQKTYSSEINFAIFKRADGSIYTRASLSIGATLDSTYIDAAPGWDPSDAKLATGHTHPDIGTHYPGPSKVDVSSFTGPLCAGRCGFTHYVFHGSGSIYAISQSGAATFVNP